MNEDVSRRRLLATAGTASLGVLFRYRFAYAEAFVACASPEVPRAPVGMELTVTAMTPHTLRISIAASGVALDRYYDDGSIAPRVFPHPLLIERTDADAREIAWGTYKLRIATKPLQIAIEHPQRGVVQELAFHPETNQIHFNYGGAPVYGLG